MASLFETIKNNQQQIGAPATPQASDTNITGQTQTLLAAKTGKAGKAAGGGVPRASNVGEQVANQNTALQMGQLAQQVAVGAQQLQSNAAHQEKQIQVQEQEDQFQTHKLDTDYLRGEDQLLDQYITGKKQLDLKKDKSKMEQIGFNLRLSNQSYMENLGNEAKRAQLDNQIKFKEELARTVFSEDLHMFEDDLQFRQSMFVDKQQFTEQMQNIDLDYAINMSDYQNKQASAAMMYTGIGQAVTGATTGANAYMAHQDKLEAQENAEFEKDAFDDGSEDEGFTGEQGVGSTETAGTWIGSPGKGGGGSSEGTV